MSSYYSKTNWPINLKDCVFDNSEAWFEQHDAGPAPVYALFICLCTIAVELIVHFGLPRVPRVSLDTDKESNTSTITIESQKRQPSKLLRAYRLIFATPAFIAVLVLFSKRMERLDLLRIWPDCKTHRGAYHVEPNWTAMFFFNIVPLVTSICGWSRALLDVCLCRFDTSIPYPSRHYPLRGGSIGWPPFLPFYVAYLVIAFPMSWFLKMKGDESENSVRLGDEERDGLMSNKEEEHGGVEYPPSYGESFPAEVVVGK